MEIATIGGTNGANEPDWTQTYSCPDDIAAAQEHWRTVIIELREQGTLSGVNGSAVERLVILRIVFDKAAKQVAENGSVIQPKARNNRSIARQSPYFQVMMQTAAAVERAEAELGLSPRRRGSTTKVDRKERQKQAADAYLHRSA